MSNKLLNENSSQYPTQDKKILCYICGYEHNPKWCSDIYCSRCLKGGHISEDCNNKINMLEFCLLCFSENHSYDECDGMPEKKFRNLISNERCFACTEIGHLVCSSNNLINKNSYNTQDSKKIRTLVRNKMHKNLQDKSNKKPLCSNCAVNTHTILDCLEDLMDEELVVQAAEASKYDTCEMCGVRGHRHNFCPRQRKTAIPNALLYEDNPISAPPAILATSKPKMAGAPPISSPITNNRIENGDIVGSRNGHSNSPVRTSGLGNGATAQKKYFVAAPRPDGKPLRQFGNGFEEMYRLGMFADSKTSPKMSQIPILTKQQNFPVLRQKVLQTEAGFGHSMPINFGAYGMRENGLYQNNYVLGGLNFSRPQQELGDSNGMRQNYVFGHSRYPLNRGNGLRVSERNFSLNQSSVARNGMFFGENRNDLDAVSQERGYLGDRYYLGERERSGNRFGPRQNSDFKGNGFINNGV